jgi:hypothetical protein
MNRTDATSSATMGESARGLLEKRLLAVETYHRYSRLHRPEIRHRIARFAPRNPSEQFVLPGAGICVATSAQAAVSLILRDGSNAQCPETWPIQGHYDQ